MKQKVILFIAVIAACAFILQDGAQAKQALSFEAWLEGFKSEAHTKHGFSKELLNRAFRNTDLLQKSIDLDRKQPESRLSYQKYLNNTVNKARINKGLELMRENRTLLARVEKKYGVPAQYIVALWGKETDYGRYTGGFSVIDSLATLAYEGRRREMFTAELLDALRIIKDGHITPEAMKGSWAGAMGQSQFMPSAFLKYAVDENKDGRRDIWNTKEDVFASIANYLSKEGWNPKEKWGRKVILPSSFDRTLEDIKTEKTVGEWSRLGVRGADGQKLPSDSTIKASLIQPNDKDAPYYLVYPNYKILLKWNRSRYFAGAVTKLADNLGTITP